MDAQFVYGLLVGAGALALAQNLGDYRIDDEFIEYVYDPVKTFLLHLFGKDSLARIEVKAKAVVHDAAAKLDNLGRSVETDAGKVLAEVKKIADEVKAKL